MNSRQLENFTEMLHSLSWPSESNLCVSPYFNIMIFRHVRVGVAICKSLHLNVRFAVHVNIFTTLSASVVFL